MSTVVQDEPALIKIQGVTKRYARVRALNGVSMEIPRGSIFGLIGPNGAGKTTLIRILAALLPLSEGQVWIGKEEVGCAPQVIQRQVGYMPDFFGVYPDLNVVEYLQFYAGIHKIPRQQHMRIINDLLELVDLSSKKDALVETLSRGMKQRLCLARALIHDPEVLLLDEPASGLDPRARVELRELLRSLQSMQKTILISSHILLELAEMCTDVAIMQGGKVVVSGPVEQVTRRLGGTRLLELRVIEEDQVTSALEVLKELPTLSNVRSENGTLILAEFDGDDRALHDTMVAVITKGVPIISFAPRSSGGRLEEVFMSITEGSSPS